LLKPYFIIASITIIHLALLHKEGSNNPIGSDVGIDEITFYPYFVSKDVFAGCFFLIMFSIFILYFPNYLNHPDNCIPADPLETPAHVVPEWYDVGSLSHAFRVENSLSDSFINNVQGCNSFSYKSVMFDYSIS